MRTYLLALTLGIWMPVHAEGPPAGPHGLPPPVQHALEQLSLDDTQRSAVKLLLLSQRDARRAQDQALRQQHRAALRQWLSADQLVAIEAALPPSPRPPRGTRPALGERPGRASEKPPSPPQR